MSGLYIAGVDPGLATSGICLLDAGRREAVELTHVKTPNDAPARMAWRIDETLHDMGQRYDFTIVGVEDFTWRPAKAVRHRQIVHGLRMARFLGRLELVLEASGWDGHWVRPQDSLRDQPMGGQAKTLGIPGKNDHERAAFYAALWLAGTIRLAGGGRR